MRLFLKILFVFVISLGISCSGDESEDITEPTVDPTAVTLNSFCLLIKLLSPY